MRTVIALLLSAALAGCAWQPPPRAAAELPCAETSLTAAMLNARSLGVDGALYPYLCDRQYASWTEAFLRARALTRRLESRTD